MGEHGAHPNVFIRSMSSRGHLGGLARTTARVVDVLDGAGFDTVIVEPKMQGGGVFRDEDATLTIWYTDDARHIPVRIRSEVKVGTITATLRAIHVGITTIEPAR